MRSRTIVAVGLSVLVMLPAFAQAPRLVWTNTFGGESAQYAMDVSQSLIDDMGNLYLVASSSLSRSPVILLQKLDSSGRILWQREWRHPQTLYLRLIGAAFDANGHINLFVAVIVSEQLVTFNTISVVRFLSSGELLDVHSYRLPTRSGFLQGIRAGLAAIDAAENRYILFQDQQENLSGTRLIKLASSWEPMWDRFLPAFYAESLHISANGEVFLIGFGYNPESPASLFRARAKVGATGALLWQILSDIPHQQASSVLAAPVWKAGSDGEGYLYGVYPDLTVEKYAADGRRIARWSYPASQPTTRDAEILSDGRIVLGGSASGARLVIVLSPSLTERWVRSDLGGASGGIVKIAANQAGEVWALLRAPSATPAFDLYHLTPEGNTAWTRRISVSQSAFIDPVEVLINPAGLCAGLGNSRFAETFAFGLDRAGNLLYNQQITHSRAPYDESRGLAIDRNNNSAQLVYSAGNFLGLSYSPEGMQRWRVSALENGDFDSMGNWITVGSRLTDSTTWNDPRAIKYAPNGQLLWDRTERLSSSQYFLTMAIAPDDAILIGGTSVEGNLWQPFLLKYSSEGQRLWHLTRSTNIALPIQLRATRDGGAYMCIQPSENSEALLVRYAATGVEQWAASVPAWLPDLLTDRWDNAFLVDFEYQRATRQYLLAIYKFSPSGALLWQNRLPIPYGTYRHLITPSGDLCGAVQQPDRLIVYRVSAGGALQWVREFAVIGDQVAIATDEADQLYVATSSWLSGFGGENQLIVRKLDSFGQQQWRFIYAMDSQERTIPRAVQVDSAGRVLIAGEFTRPTGDTDVFLLQLRPLLPGDLNGDGCVDDADLVGVLQAFGSSQAGDADLNGDDIVDDLDLLRVLFHFGSGC